MKVLIKKTNKIEEVKDSYAINHLIPRGLAVLVTDKVMHKLKQTQAIQAENLKKRKQKEKDLADRLANKEIIVKFKANDKGELFGSVGKSQIKKILKSDLKFNIKLKTPIKKLGNYPIDLKIGEHSINIILKIQKN